MKKTLLAAALIAGFGIAAVAPQAARAANTINFTGKVLNSTCSGTVNGSAAGTVVLPDVEASAFTATALIRQAQRDSASP